MLGRRQRAGHGKLDEVRAERPQAGESKHGTSASGRQGKMGLICSEILLFISNICLLIF